MTTIARCPNREPHEHHLWQPPSVLVGEKRCPGVPTPPEPQSAPEDVRQALTAVVRDAQMVAYEDGRGGWLWRGASAAEVADAVLASDWLRNTIADAEQRGREDNADHGMCYVTGSKALAARLATEREAATKELRDSNKTLAAAIGRWREEADRLSAERDAAINDLAARCLAAEQKGREAGARDALAEVERRAADRNPQSASAVIRLVRDYRRERGL